MSPVKDFKAKQTLKEYVFSAVVLHISQMVYFFAVDSFIFIDLLTGLFLSF